MNANRLFEVQPPFCQLVPRIACIVNPAGRDGHSLKRWKAVEPILKETGIEYEVQFTEGVGHASEIAYSVRERDDIDLVVACGGDGTVHEVASGLRGSDKPLGIIPAGTGNDVARAHNIPLKDTKGIVDILVNGVDRHVGAFRLEAMPAPAEGGYPAPSNNPKWDGDPNNPDRVVRWVFLESDCGITSATARAKLRRAKWIKGSLKYTYLGLTEILPWKKKKVWFQYDDNPGEEVDYTFMVASTTEMFGGGYRVCPGASPILEDGSLCFGWSLKKLQMIALMGPLRKGKHVGRWGIELTRAKKISLRATDDDGNPTEKPLTPPLIIQADGEPCMQIPADLDFHPRQLWVRGAKIVPWDL